MSAHSLLGPRSAAPDALRQALLEILAPEAVIFCEGVPTTYERDGLNGSSGQPGAIVLPSTTSQVVRLMRFARRSGMPVMPRGAGTSRCGGAVPPAGSLVIATTKLRAIVDFDPVAGRVRVQPGVRNQTVSEHVQDAGWFYAPDPSSRRTCTLGGNIATNASGACAFRHGNTASHLLGLTAVLHDGETLDLGCHGDAAPDYDLAGLLCGSEGMLAFVTEATVQLTPLAQQARSMAIGFATRTEALACASALLRAGLVPHRLEFMDRLAVMLTERHLPSGCDIDAEASLLVELQGLPEEVAEDLDLLRSTVDRRGARSLHAAPSEDDAALWRGREAIYAAVSRAGRFECLDVGVPRSALPAALEEIDALARQHGVDHASVVHAGDGTLHTFLISPQRDEAAARRACACGDAIRRLCVRLGGSITTEYGVGLGRRDLLALQWSAGDLAQQRLICEALAPGGSLNPDKVFPASAGAT